MTSNVTLVNFISIPRISQLFACHTHTDYVLEMIYIMFYVLADQNCSMVYSVTLYENKNFLVFKIRCVFSNKLFMMLLSLQSKNVKIIKYELDGSTLCVPGRFDGNASASLRTYFMCYIYELGAL